MEKSERFGLVLSPVEKIALTRLAESERIPAAAVVRRLIWSAAEERGLIAPRSIQTVELGESNMQPQRADPG